ncbi:hypothetical protein GORHZ_207_00110 [Gordonia rhizosphera NBRC 16068]|uniref:Uncharacterized protein n=1 Tax=Gordonia rhizosphera NBRC 16068 TaxID=1108045 RepID=K6WLY0_9ACTN|nr:hypothetical protein GORHZ_207_00110 [Gordonia rhizosphera NBRC 16068]
MGCIDAKSVGVALFSVSVEIARNVIPGKLVGTASAQNVANGGNQKDAGQKVTLRDPP